MFIDRMKVGSFRQIRDAEFGSFHEPADYSELIVLAGPNGSGKSSVLELLSYGLATRYSWQYHQTRTLSEHSFAIRIGLTQPEIDELEKAEQNPELIQYAKEKRGYWIEVNMPDVLDAGEMQINQQLHGIVSRQFQNFTRKLGFFLRADRGYGARAYDRRRLFDWKNRLKPQHFNNISYGQTTQQYEDMYDFLVEQSYHYVYSLGLHHKNITSGTASTEPQDPLGPYNDLLKELFPGYSFVDATAEELSLRVKLPAGNVIPFQDMSSGEKEVFFILSFFIRNDISDSVIVIDEPELHLHPELARKLIQLMRTIKPQNQIWCATHSAELVDEAGRERTFFLKQSDDRTQTECIPATNEGAEIQILRDMFGYSGYVGISKKIIFSEGTDSSADRKTFANIYRNITREIKIIPVGTYSNLYRINAAVLSLLETDFARCNFFLIRDRDYLSVASVEKHRQIAPDRLFILNRYHIENYLLDERLISEVLKDIYQKELSEQLIKAELYEIARSNSGAFLRDLVVFRFGELYQSEDCSIGNHSNNQAIITANNELDDAVLNPLKEVLLRKVEEINTAVTTRTAQDNAVSVLNECIEEVENALMPEGEGWKELFPGRYLLQRFSSAHGLGSWPALQNLLIDHLSKGTIPVNAELDRIFKSIADV
ncbi:MAG: AAA family ATPase [Gammaproteobacteria bacterium]